jgi:WD40 repeat protein
MSPRELMALAVALVATAAIASESAQPRADRLGDPLPEGAIARLGTTRFRIGGHATSIQFGPDGKTLVTTGGNGLLVWDVATGKIVHRLANESGRQLYHAVLAPDHKLAATVHYDHMARIARIQLWDAATGKQVREMGQASYAALQFSPDGKRLAAYNSIDSREGREDHIDVFDVSTGGQVSSWSAGQEGIVHVRFMKDGKRLMTGGVDKTVRIWDLDRAQELRKFTIGDLPAGYIALSADEKLFAVIDQIPNAPNASPRCPPRSLPWYADNRVRVWDLEAGKQLFDLTIERPERPYTKGITSAHFTPDGKSLITGGMDSKTRVWDLATGKEAHRYPIRSNWYAALSPDGRTFAAFDGLGVRLIDLQKEKELLSEHEPDVFVSRAMMLPDSRTVVTFGRRSGGLDLWDARTGKRQRHLPGPEGHLASWQATRDGKSVLAMPFPGETVFKWNLEVNGPGAPLKNIDPKYANWSAAMSPDGDLLAVSNIDDPMVVLLDSATGQVIRELPGHTEGARQRHFTSDGDRLVVCCGDHTLRIWDLKDGKLLKQIGPLGETQVAGAPVPVGGPRSSHYGVALSPDGRLAAYVSGNGYIALFDLNSGRQLYRVPFPESFSGFAFSANGQNLACPTYRDPAIHLIEVASGKVRQKLVGHEGGIQSVSFSPDGKLLVSASNDSTGLVWELFSDRMQKLTDAEIAQAWEDLASADAARAWEAVKRLSAAGPQAAALLGQRLRPVAAPDPAKVARLIAELDSESFAVREQATKALDELGELAVEACRQAMAKQPSAEARRRLEPLVEKHSQSLPFSDSERLRVARALEVLEHIRARDTLAALAKGASGAWVTQRAREALRGEQRTLE